MKYVDKAANGDVLMVTVERLHGQEKRTTKGKEVLTVQEVAGLLKVCDDEVYEMVRHGELPFKPVDDRIRIPKSFFTKWSYNH